MQRLERRAPAPWGKVCAFTGHRPNKYPYLSDEKSVSYQVLVSRVCQEVTALIEEGYTHFLSGGALGVDTLAARLILDMKKDVPFLTLEMAVPCPQQASRWNRADRRIHDELCESADVLTVISPFYTPFCLPERNRFMASRCDALIAVYDGTPGGTRMTLSYALDQKKRVVIVKP